MKKKSPPQPPNARNLSSSSSHSLLIGRCISLPSGHSIHARLLKLGLHRQPSLGGRLVHLYSRIGDLNSALRAFNDIPAKNIFTWNILLAAFSNAGCMTAARKVFDRMPEKDAVSWNSIISGYAGIGLFDAAFSALRAMRDEGIRVTSFTISISASCILSPPQAKQIHGSAIRFCFDSSGVVVGNSLIKMYDKVGLVEYAFSVFRRLENPDSISWNTMISAFVNSGDGCSAFGCFRSMRESGFCPDEFSISSIIGACANPEDMKKGEQLLCRCFRMGYLSNSIVCSAVIYMYSQCGRLGDSLRLFEERERWDSAILNSMLSAYAQNGEIHESLSLFLTAVRRDVRPTEFTFSSILSSNSRFGLPEQGMQIHCWVHKLGMEEDSIISSALVDMYMKLGSVACGVKVFAAMSSKDLISWNTMILGLAQNGEAVESLRKFEELLKTGIQPDRITLLGILSACSVGGLLCRGKKILSSMEEEHGIKCGIEHYACAVEMMGRAGRLEAAMEITETMPHDPNMFVMGVLLESCVLHRSMSLAEAVAERMMTMSEPRSPLPYLVLARAYGSRRMWESMAWMWKVMEQRGVKRYRGCSWIGIRNQIFSFGEDELLHHGGEDMYSALRLLGLEMAREGYVCGKCSEFEDG
ncbi:Pentatricopeptide repeat-containing protein [Platanthera zijinensis]|uniref:Pentatricopeptide repeat-containing protein n=1 Tax=Platanthera zijinensis TaxID=2320716 RepID=A0AAP0B5C6_9ASPA